jgi:hypothetical protein
MSPFLIPTNAPIATWQRQRLAAWLAYAQARAAAARQAQAAPPAPRAPIRWGRCPASSTLHCRLYALAPRGDGSFDPSVIGYIVPGGTFQIGTSQIVNLRTDQPGSFGLQAVPMVQVIYGSASGWMPTSGIEVVS